MFSHRQALDPHTLLLLLCLEPGRPGGARVPDPTSPPVTHDARPLQDPQGVSPDARLSALVGCLLTS